MANSSDNRSEYKGYEDDYWMEGGYYSFIFPCSKDFPYICFVAVIALIIAIFGIFGNIGVIASMVKQKLYKKTSHMSIMVLAVSDLLCLLVIVIREYIYFPNEFYFIEKYGISNAFCIAFFVWSYTPYLSSCFNVVFLAYERYSLVTNPLVYIDTHTPKIVVIRAIIAFLFVGAINLVYAIIMAELSKCPDLIVMPPHYAFISVPIIVGSLFSLVFFHFSKIYKLKKLNNLEGRHTRNAQQFPHMTTIVYIIVIIFIVSQIPYLILDTISIYEAIESVFFPYEYCDIILHVAIIVFLINYASNPYIYWITPLSMKCKRRKRDDSQETSSTRTKTASMISEGEKA